MWWGDLAALEGAQLALVLGSLVLILANLAVMASSNAAGKESVRILTTGRLWPLFVVGVLVVGLAIPLAVGAYGQLGDSGLAISVLALNSVLILIGSYLFRYSMLRAGLYAPLT